MTIDEATLSNLKDRLEREQQSSRRDLEQIEAEIRAMTRGSDQEGGVPANHMADNGSDVYELERLSTIQAEFSERLELIDVALHRMQIGTYGSCERCEREIAPARLAALPFARYCIECQEILEDEQHVSGVAQDAVR